MGTPGLLAWWPPPSSPARHGMSLWWVVGASLLVAGRVPGAELSGRVTDPGGAPVTDVDLDLVDLATGLTLETPDDDTDSDGDYAVEVPAGSYRILFEPPGGLRLAPHIEPRVEVGATNVELDVVLPTGFSLAGRVTDPSGIGVADVDLDVHDRALCVKLPTPGDRTNQLGFFSLIVPQGTYQVMAAPPVASRLVPMRADSVSVPGIDVILNLRLEPGVVLSGAVRTAGGEGVAGIDLDATDLETGADVPLGDDSTGDAGEFAMVLRTGRYMLDIDAPTATHLVSDVFPVLALTADQQLDLELERGFVVEGTVVGPDGLPIEAANLDFLVAESREVIRTPADHTNLYGEYAVVLPAGNFDVIARAPAGTELPPDTTLAVAVFGDRRLDLYFGPDPAPLSGLILEPAFPNPTPAGVTLPFVSAPGQESVEIEIYNASGELVDVLRGTPDAQGRGQVIWDGKSQRGFPAPSGVYFVRGSTPGAGQAGTQKLVIFREKL